MTLTEEDNQEGTGVVGTTRRTGASGCGHDKQTVPPLDSALGVKPETNKGRRGSREKADWWGARDSKNRTAGRPHLAPLHLVSVLYTPEWSLGLVTLQVLRDTGKQVSAKVCSLSRPRAGSRTPRQPDGFSQRLRSRSPRHRRRTHTPTGPHRSLGSHPYLAAPRHPPAQVSGRRREGPGPRPQLAVHKVPRPGTGGRPLR